VSKLEGLELEGLGLELELEGLELEGMELEGLKELEGLALVELEEGRAS
jgi:hypothetical protein